jgi:pectinesterase
MNRRTVLAMGGIAIVSPPIAHAAPKSAWDLVVSKSGRPGTVASIKAAVDRARAAARPFRVFVEAGVYVEKPRIDVSNLHIEGEGAGSVISFDAAAGLRDAQGKPWGTGGSATLTITAPGVTLANLTIRNGFDYLDNLRTRAVDGAQAVALSLARGSDNTIVRHCAIEGYQDTLYVQENGHAAFADCLISGCVDFIFGGAAALFDHCEIRSRAVPHALSGFIAAPSTPAAQPIGLIFDRCRLTRENGVPDGSIYLGRPWRAGGNMQLTGAAAFLDCWMDAHIHHGGWTSMGFRGTDGARRQLTPGEARLFEYKSSGPGAKGPSPTRRLLPAEQAAVLAATVRRITPAR